MTMVSQLWDLIEIWRFCEDIDDMIAAATDNNNDEGISALGLDRDLGFS